MILLERLGWRYGMTLLEELVRLGDQAGMLMLQRLMEGMERRWRIGLWMETLCKTE